MTTSAKIQNDIDDANNGFIIKLQEASDLEDDENKLDDFIIVLGLLTNMEEYIDDLTEIHELAVKMENADHSKEPNIKDEIKQNAIIKKTNIIEKYKESLTQLEKEFRELGSKGTKLNTLYGASSKTMCGTKTCRQILEDIAKDPDFKELAKGEPFGNLQKILTNKNDLSIQAGGSK